MNLQDLANFLTHIEGINAKTEIYLMLDSRVCNKAQIEKPPLKLNAKAIKKVIEHDLSARELSTAFFYDYKIKAQHLEFYYLAADLYHAFFNMISPYSPCFLGVDPHFNIEQPLNARTIRSLHRNGFNFLPWRDMQWQLLKKKLFVFLTAFALFITSLLSISHAILAPKKAQLIQENQELIAKKQQHQARIQALNQHLSSSKYKTSLDVLLNYFEHIPKALQEGIWLTTIEKDKQKLQLQGQALAPFLIDEFKHALEAIFPDFAFQLEKKAPFHFHLSWTEQ